MSSAQTAGKHVTQLGNKMASDWLVVAWQSTEDKRVQG